MSRFPTALPTARTPDAAAAPALRWGVLGTGWIAERFISTVQRNTRQRVEAIGSRGADRSAAFAARFGVPRLPRRGTGTGDQVATVTQVPVSAERAIASRAAALRTASSSVVPYVASSATERRKWYASMTFRSS